MVRWIALLALSATSLTNVSLGEEPPPNTAELLQQIRHLQERLDAVETKHDADQKHIEELEARLERVEGTAPEPSPVGTKPSEQSPAPVEGASAPGVRGVFDFSSGGSASLNAYNPQMTAIIDTGASVSSDGHNKALNRFNVREVELDIRSAISPQADGVLVLAIGEEIESERNGDVNIDHAIEIEEGFFDFHTLPFDTGLKFGKFRASFGRNNVLHTHDLPQVTRPLALQAFLGSEGLSSTGASFSWQVPNPWNQYLELNAEVINADGGEESPILGGPNADNPAVLAHLNWFHDLTPTSSIDLGGSFLYTHTTGDGDFDANVFGLDAAYTWTHPDPSKFRSLLVQGEVYFARNDVDRAWFWHVRNGSLGAYAFAQYQLGQEWYLGLRGDYTEFPDSESRGSDDWDIAFSPYVTRYLTEFLRIRLEYQHRLEKIFDDHSNEDAVFLQLTGVFGSHPAHPYWVHR